MIASASFFAITSFGGVVRISGSLFTFSAITGSTISIPVQAERWSAGSGNTLMAFGIPLIQGQLSASNLGNVSVWLTGSEIPVYAETLGAYPDGTARSLYIQALQPATSGSPIAGEIRIGTGYSQARRTLVETSGTFINTGSGTSWNGAGLPDGAIVPTSPLQICGGLAHGSYIPLTSELDFTGRASYQTALTDTVVSTVLAQAGFPHYQANYNRGQALFALWARTADSTYLKIGLSNTSAYRTNYYAGANFALPETQQHTDTMAQWYLLTRDDTAFTQWIAGLIENGPNSSSNVIATLPRSSINQWLYYTSLGGRAISRIYGQLAAVIKTNPLGKNRISSGQTYEQHSYDWLARVTESPFWNGNTWTTPGFESDGVTPKVAAYPYMSAMMCTEIIELCKLITPNSITANALNAVKTSLDYFRTVSSPQMLVVSDVGTISFNYSTTYLYDRLATGPSVLAGNPTSTGGQVDLNGVYAHLYAWRAANGGTLADVQLAQALYASIGITNRDGHYGPYLVGDKQWDESFYRAQQTPAYLSQAKFALPSPSGAFSGSAGYLANLPNASSSAANRRFPDWAKAKAFREAPLGSSILEADGKIKVTKIALGANHPYAGPYVGYPDGNDYYMLATYNYSSTPYCYKYTIGGSSSRCPDFPFNVFDGGVLMSRNPNEPKTAYAFTFTSDTATLVKIGDVNYPSASMVNIRTFSRADMHCTSGALATTAIYPNAMGTERKSRYFTFTSFPQPGGGGSENTIVFYDRLTDTVKAWKANEVGFYAGMSLGGGTGFQASGFNDEGTVMFASDGADQQACVYSIASDAWSQRYVRPENTQPQNASQPRSEIGHNATVRSSIAIVAGAGMSKIDAPATFASGAYPSWINNESDTIGYPSTRHPRLDGIGALHLTGMSGLTDASGSNEWVANSYYARTFGNPNIALLGWNLEGVSGTDYTFSMPVRTINGTITGSVASGSNITNYSSLSALTSAPAGILGSFYSSSGVLYIRNSNYQIEGVVYPFVYDYWNDARSPNLVQEKASATLVPAFQWRNDGAGVYSAPYILSQGYQRDYEDIVGVAFGQSLDVVTAVTGGAVATPGGSMRYDLSMAKANSVAAMTGSYQWFSSGSRLYIKLPNGRAPLTSDAIDAWQAVPGGPASGFTFSEFGHLDTTLYGGESYTLWNSSQIFLGDLYWVTPRLAMSPNGRVGVFGSNLGECLRGDFNMPRWLCVMEFLEVAP